MNEILTAEQVRRYRQIQLQSAVSRQGPLYAFRYRLVAEGLGLTKEQADKLQAAYQEFLSPYWSAYPEASAEELTKSQRVFDATLTAEQKNRWGQLLGEPRSAAGPPQFASDAPTPRPAATTGSGQPNPPTASTRRTIQFGATELACSYTTLLSQPVVEELKLTDAQRKSLGERQSGPDGGRTIADATLAEMLTPEQMHRCRQLQLQQAIRAWGPLTLLHYRFVVERLSLTPPQHEQLKAAFEKFFSDMRTVLSGEGREQAQHTIDAILTAEQKARWQDLFGDIRILSEFGQLDLPVPSAFLGSSLLTLPCIRELQLTEPQIKAIQERRAASTGSATATQAVDLSDILNAEQWRRYRAWGVQLPATGFSTSDPTSSAAPSLGPISFLRYRPLIEGLDLSADQRTKLQTLYQDWMGRHWSARSLSAEERVKAQSAIGAILSAEQQARWKHLLGEPLPDLRPIGTTRSELGTAGFANSYNLLQGEPVVEALQLTPAQLAALETRRIDLFSSSAVLTDTALAEILTPDQLRRFRQIELQTAVRRGPLNALQFRFVLETLGLTPEQVAPLQSAYQELQQRTLPGPRGATVSPRPKNAHNSSGQSMPSLRRPSVRNGRNYSAKAALCGISARWNSPICTRTSRPGPSSRN